MYNHKFQINTFSNMLFLLVLFPYISLMATPFDTQPFALLFSMFFFLILLAWGKRNLSFPSPLWLIFFIFFYAVGLYLFYSDYNYGLRSIAGYASVFFIALASYKTFRHINLKVYYLTVFIWLLVGIVQLLFEKKFGRCLLPRMSTSLERGVTSLAVEPSFYAIFCIFLLILNEVFYKNGKYSGKLYFVFMFALVFQIVISFSGVGIVSIIVFFFAKYISTLIFDRTAKSWYLALLIPMIPIFVIISFLYLPVLQNTRANTLISKAASDPIALCYVDQSVADRSSHIVIPFYSLIYSHGIGLGLGTWGNNAALLTASAGGWVSELANVNLSMGGRVLSGWGTAIYELGGVGVLFILVFLWIMFMGMKRNKKMRPVYALSMIVLFFIILMAVPLAFPLFGYMLGIFLYYAYADYKTAYSLD